MIPDEIARQFADIFDQIGLAQPDIDCVEIRIYYQAGYRDVILGEKNDNGYQLHFNVAADRTEYDGSSVSNEGDNE